MIIVMIRRFVRPDREGQFLTDYRASQPNNPAFLGETLTRLSEDTGLPPGLRSLELSAPSCVTYLNIARWESWSDFLSAFPKSAEGGGFDPDVETAPRERAVFEVKAETVLRQSAER